VSAPPETFVLGSLDRLLELQTTPVLGALPPHELAAFAEHARPRSFLAGQVLLDEGAPTGSIHLIIEGQVRVSRRGNPFRVFGPREAVGVIGLLARTDTGVHAVAMRDTLTLELTREALLEVFEDHFGVLEGVLRSVARLLLSERLQIHGDAGLKSAALETLTCPARPLDLVERIFVLRQSLPFASTSVDALAGLARRVEELRLAAGERLWTQDHRADSMLVLVCGSVEGVVDGGRQRFRFGSRASIGGVDALAGAPRWYTATALEPVVALKINIEELMDLFEDHFDLALELLAALSRDILAVFELRATAEGDPAWSGSIHP
jgi:CRP-like cAMP-binding protein